MSGAFVRKWTDEQRDAVIAARIVDRLKFREVVEAAEKGRLKAPDGTALEPFTMPVSTIASLVRDEKKRRMGGKPTTLAQLEPRDAIEALRVRLVSAADAMLTHELKRPTDKQDPERLRQIGRCVREFAAIKAPGDAPARAPGQRENGTQPEATTQNGMAAEILKANRAQDSTAQDTSPMSQTYTDRAEAATRAADDDTQERRDKKDDAPGSLASAAARSLVPAA